MCTQSGFVAKRWCVGFTMAILTASAAQDVGAQQALASQLGWRITIPFVELDPITLSVVRSYVELDALPLTLAVDNPTRSRLGLNLNELQKRLNIRVEPVEAQVNWPKEVTLSRRSSEAEVLPWRETLELSPGDVVNITLTAVRRDAPRFSTGKYVVVSRADGVAQLQQGSREWNFEVRPPSTDGERAAMYQLEAERLVRNGNSALALQAVEAAVEAHPGDSRARYLLGLSYLGAARYREAIASLEQVAESTPPGSRGRIASALAQAHLVLGDEASALAALRMDGLDDLRARTELAKIKERIAQRRAK